MSTTDSLYAPRRSTAERAARQLQLKLLQPRRPAPKAKPRSRHRTAASAAGPAASPLALAGDLTGLLPRAVQALLLTLAVQACVLLLPWFLQNALDRTLSPAGTQASHALAAGAALCAVGFAAMALLRSWAVLGLASHIKVQWLTTTYSQLLRLPLAYFETHGLDELASRFQSLAALHRALTRNGIETLFDGVVALGAWLLLLFYSPALAAGALLAVTAYGLLRRAAHAPLREVLQQQLKLEAQEQSLWFESVRHMSAIRRSTRESGWRARWIQSLVGGMNHQLAAERLQLLLTGARTLSAGAVLVLALWWAPTLTGSLSAGMLLACAGYTTLFMWRGLACLDRCAEVALLRVHAERLGAEHAAAAQPSAGTAPLPATGALELRNVWFRYTETSPWVLKDVSLTVSPGESLALIGPSGGGKSTLLKLMLGLHTPQRGQVLYGGVPLEQLDARAYRRAVAAVLQDDLLASGTLLDNITFYATTADMKRVVDCTMKAALHDEIMALPARYNTRVGGLGERVSSGEKQRLMLARALYQEPRLLLLDEATSHVDTRAEQHILGALQCAPFARVVVAHRPETTLGMPRTVVLEGGCITKDLSSVVTVTDVVPMALNDSHMGHDLPVLRVRV
jgi:ATP-binding cassette subfamily B protein RaxB